MRIGGIIDGAMVTIEHSSGAPSEKAAFDISTLTFMLAHPLPKQGEKLSITQDVRVECERKPSASLDLQVAPAERPTPPGVMSLCPGVVQVLVTNLVTSATVTITIDGIPYYGVAPPDKTAMVFEVAPVAASATVEVVQQNTCGLLSDKTVAPVAALGTPSKANLSGPLLECARVVRVQNAQPGSYLQVWAQTSSNAPRPISTRVATTQSSVRIAVTPYLVNADSIWVEQLACSGNWVASDHVQVQTAAVKPVEIPFPIEDDDLKPE